MLSVVCVECVVTALCLCELCKLWSVCLVTGLCQCEVCALQNVCCEYCVFV